MITISYSPLEQILAARGISKGQLARGAGLSKATLAKIGNNEPLSLEVLARIAVYLNESLGGLVSITDNKSQGFSSILLDPANKDFRKSLLSPLVYSASLLSGCRWTLKEIESYLFGQTDPTGSKDDFSVLVSLAKTIAEIVAKPRQTFDAMLVNEIMSRFLSYSDTNVDKAARKKLSRFAFKWTAVSSLSPEEQAAFIADAAEVIGRNPAVSTISYILLLKLCLLSSSYVPLLSEELVVYFSDGIASYQSEPTYLIAAIESGIEQTKSLMKRHFVPLF